MQNFKMYTQKFVYFMQKMYHYVSIIWVFRFTTVKLATLNSDRLSVSGSRNLCQAQLFLTSIILTFSLRKGLGWSNNKKCLRFVLFCNSELKIIKNPTSAEIFNGHLAGFWILYCSKDLVNFFNYDISIESLNSRFPQRNHKVP